MAKRDWLMEQWAQMDEIDPRKAIHVGRNSGKREAALQVAAVEMVLGDKVLFVGKPGEVALMEAEAVVLAENMRIMMGFPDGR